MDENTPHKDSDITIGNWDEAFGILSTRKEAISDRYTPPAKKCQELAHHATTAIAALMNDGSDGVDYRAVLALSLPDAVYERSVTVVVDGSAAWPLIATLRNAGRTPEQIIVDLQAWGYVRHGGAVWTPDAVEEIFHRWQSPPLPTTRPDQWDQLNDLHALFTEASEGVDKILRASERHMENKKRHGPE